jgi:hypothetical protein
MFKFERLNVGAPLFSVGVASKGVSFGVSLLFATHTGMSRSVASKGVVGH